MQRHPLSTILGRPALHLLLALAFGVAFCWPIMAMTRPSQTFEFLYVSWIISLVVLFAISRSTPADAADSEEIPPIDDASTRTTEITRESL